MSVTTPEDLGCPSGLEPPRTETEIADPSPFVVEEKGSRRLELLISGASCSGCIAKIEGRLKQFPQVSEARLNLSTGKLAVQWSGDLAPRSVVEAVTGLGFGAVPFDPQASRSADDARGRELLRCMAVAGFAAANIMLLSIAVWGAGGDAEMGEATRSFMHLVSGLIAIPAAAYAARPFFSSALGALRKGGANMDVPISLAVILAVGVSLVESLRGGEHAYFDAAVMLLFFLLIGRWLDHRLRTKARSAARDLLALQETTALRQSADGEVEAISAQTIKPGDRLVLTPGMRLPVNGTVREGESDVDTAFLTGEVETQLAREGTQLFGGTKNLSGRLYVEATATVDQSLVSDLVRLVEAGQQAKDRYTVLADKAARAYVPIVHTLAALTIVGWLLLGHGVREAIMAATAVLIITCPCALGLATPAVQVVATGQLFRRGVFVKSGNALERLAKVRHIIFDKTGTLTLGKLQWTNPHDFKSRDTRSLAALARAGLHPISRAIAEASGPGDLADGVEEIPGAGISGMYRDRHIKLGSAEFVGAEGPLSRGSDGPEAWLRIDDGAPKRLTFEDRLHADGHDTMDELKAGGLSLSLLSGDRPGAVSRVAATLGLEDWTAGVRPEEKAEIVGKVRDQNGATAMVGDGINDAAALALADVSFSPGSASDAAQSAADFVIPSDGIHSVHDTWRMAIRSRRTILQNFTFAAVYNLIAAPLAMAGLVTPLIAALAMSGSSLVVTLNALRLRTGQPK
ncbi:MAG: heavy metal translocating P-type ATPase [Pseudomonadota bacterium]